MSEKTCLMVTQFVAHCKPPIQSSAKSIFYRAFLVTQVILAIFCAGMEMMICG